MDNKRREEIKQIIERFIDAPITQNVLDEFCNLNGFTSIVVGELQDYIVQYNHDKKVGVLFQEILSELQNLKYTPEFDTDAVRNNIHEENDKVRVNIVKLMEDHALEYRFVSTVADELGGIVGQTIKSAGQTAFNKAIEVMQHITREKFGSLLNMSHVAEYTKQVFEKAKQAQDTTPTNESEGSNMQGT